MATSHRATNDPPVEDPKADAPAKAKVEAEVEAPTVEATDAEKAKAARRDTETPARSDYATAAAEWAAEVNKTISTAQEKLEALIKGHTDVMGNAPGVVDARAGLHVARVRESFNDLARVYGAVRAVASDLTAAVG